MSKTARHAIIDIGSNSIKVAVLDRLSGRELARASEAVRLFPAAAGEVLLSPETIEAGAQAVARLVAKAKELQADPVVLLGTSALRECVNRAAFDARLRELTGLGLTVVSGEVEARLAADGVPTSREFRKDQPVRLPIIQAAAAVGPGFGQVQSITPAGPESVRILGENGQAVTVPLNWNYLKR